MKSIVLLLVIAIYSPAFCQDYTSAGVAFEMMSEHAEYEDFFGARDSAFKIQQYVANDKNNRLRPEGGCAFEFMPNDVIKTRVFGRGSGFHKTNYWKWTKNEKGEKFGYVEECTKKGVIVDRNPTFKIVSTKLVSGDSIIDESSYWINQKGDTACDFFDRWIYRQDTLKEYWHQYVGGGTNPSWDEQEKFSITTYIYPARNTTITEYFTGNIHTRQSDGRSMTTIYYNESGKKTAVVRTDPDHPDSSSKSEDKFFYRNGHWCRTERWGERGVREVITKENYSTK